MTDSLVKELTAGVPGFPVEPPAGKVNCHTLSPGMVFTDLLLNDSTPELRKFPFGVLAAQPEEVALDLIPKICRWRVPGRRWSSWTRRGYSPASLSVSFCRRKANTLMM